MQTAKIHYLGTAIGNQKDNLNASNNRAPETTPAYVPNNNDFLGGVDFNMDNANNPMGNDGPGYPP